MIRSSSVRYLNMAKCLSHVAMADCLVPGTGEPPAKKLKQDKVEGVSASLENVGAVEDSSFTGLLEKSVGICEYLSHNTSGFFAVIKRRYSDFIVHELAKDGAMVKLSSYSLPVETAECSLDESDLEALLGADYILAMKQLAESDDKAAVLKLSVPLEKEQRGVVHKAVRALYPCLQSETIEEGEGECCPSLRKTIVLRHSSSTKSDPRGNWPRERGSYCKFVLYKENKDTMDAVSVISRLLKLKPSCFSYAGTKDRRAITSQHLTAFKISANKLQALNHKLRNMKLGNFEYVPRALKIGELAGNHFFIILRNVSCEDHVITEGVESLTQAGFINYFGMQRFGTSAIPTHHIGRCLMHSDWLGAIDLVLKPRPGESEDVSLARDFYQSSCGDAAGTLERMPMARHVERSLLHGLQKHGSMSNYLGAFNFIPKNIRLLYVHSWQSWFWNHLVSWRLQHLGPRPVVGDLVRRLSDDDCNGKSVSHVTEEDLSEYKLTDVVLPLPGSNVQLPANEVKMEYERLLTEEGICMEQFQQKVRSLALTGSYRCIVVKPESLQWETFQYDDVTIPMVLTDVDLIAAKPSPSSSGGSRKAMKLEFSLPSSSYATMAVRELIKIDTSPGYQSTLVDS